MKKTVFLFIFSTLLSILSASEIENKQVVACLNAPTWKTFGLSEVQLSDSYFKQAMDRHKSYVLSLEIDRLIPHVLKTAGLQPKGENYGGWEKGGGCTWGHYMSSCALYYAATGEKVFSDRLDYILSELKKCQNQFDDGWFITGKRGKEGYEALLNGQLFLNQPDETKQPWNFNKNGNSWYCIHKILAGLRDAYVYADRSEAKEILIKLSDYIADLAIRSNSDLFQAMLSVEQGGMNEVLTDVYAITGNEKYLQAAQRFNHINVIYPTANGEDVLSGRHANDQIPKFQGVARQYDFINNKAFIRASENFWDIVIRDHTMAIGGNSCYERFGIPGEESKRLDYSSAETCNTYNMLKLSKHLFTHSGNMKYLNYYEHALYNHILASQDPDMEGCVTYYTALMPGLFKQYSTPYESFWCCVGTGMENHAKYAESIYFYTKDSLLINLFIPSTLNWKETGLKMTLRTQFPESDNIQLRLDDNGTFNGNVFIRIPEWLQSKPQIQINGENKEVTIKNGCIVLQKLRTGDEIIITYQRSLYVDYVKDEPHFGSIMYGPVVLAGALGNDHMPDDRVSGNRALKDAVPLKNITPLVGDLNNLSGWIVEDIQKPLHFKVNNGEKQSSAELIPYFKMHHQRYTVYWKIYSPEIFRQRRQALTDEVMIADTDNEKKHNLQGQNDTIRWHDYFWAKNTQYRDAINGGWFSYDLKINKKETNPYHLICRYWGDETPKHEFDILIDGKLLKTINLNRRLYLTYVDDLYLIPQEWTKGKDKINVRFQAKEEKTAGGIYQLKITSDPDLR